MQNSTGSEGHSLVRPRAALTRSSLSSSRRSRPLKLIQSHLHLVHLLLHTLQVEVPENAIKNLSKISHELIPALLGRDPTSTGPGSFSRTLCETLNFFDGFDKFCHDARSDLWCEASLGHSSTSERRRPHQRLSE